MKVSGIIPSYADNNYNITGFELDLTNLFSFSSEDVDSDVVSKSVDYSDLDFSIFRLTELSSPTLRVLV